MKDTKVRMSFEVPKGTRDTMEDLRVKTGIPFSEMVRRGIDQYLNKEKDADTQPPAKS